METLQALDAPLPVQITGTGAGWLRRYRRYPVFSAPWFRGRWPLVVLAWLVAMAFSAPLLLEPDPTRRPWAEVIETTLWFGVPALAGPLLGLWVRRRGWPPRTERAALAAVVAGVVLLMGVYYAFGREPLKQAIAERTGNVDEHGQRRRVVLIFGLHTASPARGLPALAEAEAAARRSPPEAVDAWLRALSATLRLAVACVLAGGLAVMQWRRERDALAALARERELAQAQARRREAEMRLSVLAAQVEPHFLFNTLAGVRAAIATDPARASEMVDRLAEYLRAAIPRLRGGGVAQATVQAQFDIVRAYLALMAARLPRLRCTLDLPDELRGVRCPPLMLISLAENAVRHGVEPKIGPAQVTVSARREADGRLSLSVEDDGVGFGADTAGSGIGLSNIRERLAALYGDAAALTLRAREGGGVTATLTLPLQPPEAQERNA